jgi:hypothetical protein
LGGERGVVDINQITRRERRERREDPKDNDKDKPALLAP